MNRYEATAVGIFYMNQYIADIPDELIEAARIDGCRNLPFSPILDRMFFYQGYTPFYAAAISAIAKGVYPIIIPNLPLLFLLSRFSFPFPQTYNSMIQ